MAKGLDRQNDDGNSTGFLDKVKVFFSGSVAKLTGAVALSAAAACSTDGSDSSLRVEQKSLTSADSRLELEGFGGAELLNVERNGFSTTILTDATCTEDSQELCRITILDGEIIRNELYNSISYDGTGPIRVRTYTAAELNDGRSVEIFAMVAPSAYPSIVLKVGSEYRALKLPRFHSATELSSNGSKVYMDGPADTIEMFAEVDVNVMWNTASPFELGGVVDGSIPVLPAENINNLLLNEGLDANERTLLAAPGEMVMAERLVDGVLTPIAVKVPRPEVGAVILDNTRIIYFDPINFSVWEERLNLETFFGSDSEFTQFSSATINGQKGIALINLTSDTFTLRIPDVITTPPEDAGMDVVEDAEITEEVTDADTDTEDTSDVLEEVTDTDATDVDEEVEVIEDVSPDSGETDTEDTSDVLEEVTDTDPTDADEEVEVIEDVSPDSGDTETDTEIEETTDAGDVSPDADVSETTDTTTDTPDSSDTNPDVSPDADVSETTDTTTDTPDSSDTNPDADVSEATDTTPDSSDTNPDTTPDAQVDVLDSSDTEIDTTETTETPPPKKDPQGCAVATHKDVEGVLGSAVLLGLAAVGRRKRKGEES